MKISKNYLCFLCYISIFALMLLFEAQRFSTYFTRESIKIPQLSFVGQSLYEVGQNSGINDFMDKLTELNTALSPKIIIDSQKPYLSQFGEIVDYYAHFALYALGFAQNIKADYIISSHKKSIEQAKALPKEKIIGKEPSLPTKESVKIEEVKPSLENMYAEQLILADEKTPKPKVIPVAEKPLKFYAKENFAPAPTKQALEIYYTDLPDFGKKIKVLIAGDSMVVDGLGPSLQTMLKERDDLDVVRFGRSASGLSRPDFYNWNVNLQRLIIEHDPSLIVVSLGANDTQDIVNIKRHGIDTQSWEKVYSIRAMNFLELAADDNRQVLWVSLPVMVKMPYANRTKLISKIQAEVCTYFENATFVNIEHLLTQDGKFVGFIKGKDNKTIRLRAKDNIHVTRAGGNILAKYIIPYLDENIVKIQNNTVNNNPLIPVAGFANKVEFTSKLRQKKVEYYVFLPQIDANVSKYMPAQIMNIQNLAKNNPSTEELMDKSFALKKFPVLYLLHGAYDDGSVWNKQLGAELQKIANEKQIIIVSPSAEEFGWYVDSPFIASNQIESFITKELIPHIDKVYPSSGKRAIAGLSMGGHGALSLGLKYPKLFSSSASISGVLDLRLHKEQWKIKDLLGQYSENEKLWNKNSVNYQIQTKKAGLAPAQIIISTGTEDLLVLEDNRNAKLLLEKQKYNFEYQEHKGNHDWTFWTSHLPRIFREQADFLNTL